MNEQKVFTQAPQRFPLKDLIYNLGNFTLTTFLPLFQEPRQTVFRLLKHVFPPPILKYSKISREDVLNARK
jgi:hypothetical protein